MAWVPQDGDVGAGGFVLLLSSIFKMAYLGDRGNTEAAVDRGKLIIDHLSTLDTHNIGEAIVTFNYEAHCNNLYDDQRRTQMERFGDFIKCAKSKPKFQGRRLHVTPAPSRASASRGSRQGLTLGVPFQLNLSISECIRGMR